MPATAQLAANALTNLANVKESGAVTISTDDNLLIRCINNASQRVESYLRRSIYWQGSIVEKKGGYGTVRIVTRKTPIRAVQSVSIDGGSTLLDPTEYSIDNADAGTLIYLQASGDGPRTWPWTTRRRPDIAQDLEPGAERRDLIVVSYTGGWTTQPQADAAGLWPGATKTVYLDQMVRPAGQQTQLWQVSAVSATTGVGVTGGSEPAWGGSPAIGATVTDGSATWTYVGVYGTATTGVTLPDDIEQACIDMAVSIYQRRGDNIDVMRERVGDASVDYGTTRGEMSDGVKRTLDPYASV